MLGRCTMDIRVCCSPGRDRDVELKKKNKDATDVGKLPVSQTRSGRKRGGDFCQCL